MYVCMYGVLGRKGRTMSLIVRIIIVKYNGDIVSVDNCHGFAEDSKQLRGFGNCRGQCSWGTIHLSRTTVEQRGSGGNVETDFHGVS